MLAPGGIIGNGGGPYKTYKGFLSVHQAEAHDRLVNELFHRHTSVNSTVAVASLPGAVSVELTDTTGFIDGDPVQINNGQVETTFPIITDNTANVLTFDRPLDFGYDIGDTVEVVHTDLRTDIGSLATPVVHILKPEPGVVWYINRIILAMTHSAESTDDKFGGITALTNGVVLRANINGQYGSFTNWKTNEDIILDMFDVNYSAKAGPSLFGTSARGSFSRVGVLVRLDGDVGDFMDVLVQDDLQLLTSFFINGQGYIEDAG